MINLSPEQEKKLLDEYHVKKALRDAEAQTQAQALAKEREERKKEIAAAIAKQTKVVTVRVSHVCESCKAVIPAGAKVVAVSTWGNVSRSGYTGGYLTYHYCGVCRPIVEA